MVNMEEKVRTIQVLLWIGQVLTSLLTLPSRGLQDYMKLRHASPQTLSTKDARTRTNPTCVRTPIEHEGVRREYACQGDEKLVEEASLPGDVLGAPLSLQEHIKKEYPGVDPDVAPVASTTSFPFAIDAFARLEKACSTGNLTLK